MLEDFERNWSNLEAYLFELDSNLFPISLLLNHLRMSRHFCWRILLSLGSNENLSFAVCLKQIILGSTDFAYCTLASIPSRVMSTLQQVNQEYKPLPTAYKYLCLALKKIVLFLKTSWGCIVRGATALFILFQKLPGLLIQVLEKLTSLLNLLWNLLIQALKKLLFFLK